MGNYSKRERGSKIKIYLLLATVHNEKPAKDLHSKNSRWQLAVPLRTSVFNIVCYCLIEAFIISICFIVTGDVCDQAYLQILMIPPAHIHDLLFFVKSCYVQRYHLTVCIILL